MEGKNQNIKNILFYLNENLFQNRRSNRWNTKRIWPMAEVRMYYKFWDMIIYFWEKGSKRWPKENLRQMRTYMSLWFGMCHFLCKTAWYDLKKWWSNDSLLLGEKMDGGIKQKNLRARYSGRARIWSTWSHFTGTECGSESRQRGSFCEPKPVSNQHIHYTEPRWTICYKILGRPKLAIFRLNNLIRTGYMFALSMKL